jgi:acyl-CoA synthetase (AMP-forming)/AMP-acid ligase II
MDKKTTLNDNTLIKLWDDCIKKLPEKDAIVFLKAGEQPLRWSYLELFGEAEKFAVELKKKGVKQGDVCAIVIRHNPYFYPIYLGIILLRAVPAVLAYPNPRLHQEKFLNGIRGMTKKSGFDWILTEKEMEGILHQLIYMPNSKVKGMLFPLEDMGKVSLSGKDVDEIRSGYFEIEPGDNLLLQHSSGTTGLQKPVLLTHEAVHKHLQNYSEAIHLTHKDKVISWLPLYHDMGLIAAFHLPLAYGVTSVQIDPFEWAAAPVILLQAITKEKATLAWMPNFSFSFMASKIREEDLSSFNLESIRMIINCSEPVRDDSIEKFKIRYAEIGLKPNAVSTCYAMAETTFAVTQTPPDSEPVKLHADYLELKGHKIKVINDKDGDIKTLVSSGEIINGCKIRIVDEKGFDLGEGNIGEIAVSSESLFSGYRHYPEKTKSVLKNGWYHTGDNGFMYKDNLYVLGRIDDLIISGGNNIYPEDVEDSINDLVGVIPGRVVVFGEYDEAFGSEYVCVIAETEFTEIKDKRHLKVQIIKTGMEINVNIRRVFLVPHKWLIKSSSGKLSRKENKIRIFEALNEMEI